MSDTPQPMSDAEIKALCKRLKMPPIMCDTEGFREHLSRFLAARDAQWVAMLGEPVATVRIHMTGGNAGIAWSGVQTKNSNTMPEGTPLYAIKETP